MQRLCSADVIAVKVGRPHFARVKRWPALPQRLPEPYPFLISEIGPSFFYIHLTRFFSRSTSLTSHMPLPLEQVTLGCKHVEARSLFGATIVTVGKPIS
jgi:hypothetical protein